jgi:hypothetical protein
MKLRLILLLIQLLCMINIQAQTSKVNVTIDGPGVVDEYYVQSTDGKKQVKLKAVTNKILDGVTFDGWSGDAGGISEELTVDADKAQNIHAKFSWRRPTRKYPLVDHKLSNADHKNYYIEEKCYEFHNPRARRGANYIPIDYNRDGYIDFVEFAIKGGMGTDNHRENVRFWLANEDGTFIEDPKNDDKLMGAVFCNRLAHPDLNEDGYPDFCAFSTGYDRDGSHYDHPLILMSDEMCTYHEVRYPEHVQYFHGGTSGDFNNDGHVDVLFLSLSNLYESLLLINKGNGELVDTDPKDVFKFDNLFAEYGGIAPVYLDCEFCDLNNDGFLDFVLCGNDSFESDTYNAPPMVFWGDGKTFSPDRSAKLLDTPYGYGISHSPVFYDLNGDGVKEIIITKLGDGVFGGSIFYGGVIHQVFELNGTEYVDKTDQYIPEQYGIRGTLQTWMEEIDGRVFFCNGQDDEAYTPGEAVCPGSFKVYELVDGILKPVYYPTKTKIESYEEGFAIYADNPTLVDYIFYDDGVNPNDVGVAWGATDQWDGSPSGDMWRMDPHYNHGAHMGTSCLRWNRDGLDPEKEYGSQFISFAFISDIDIQKLADEGYYLEFYIKNTDANLTMNLGFESNGKGLYATISGRHTDEKAYNGEWQRVLLPLSAFSGDGSFSNVGNFIIRIGKGDFNNEFFLDDIRIRRLADSGIDDYDRAFIQGYVSTQYQAKERSLQVYSQEFKAMLKPLIQKFEPDSMSYFNEYITDFDEPLTRGMATIMAYYVARCIGAEYQNTTNDFPEDIWDGDFTGYDELLPHWNAPGEEDYPEGMWWRSTGFGGFQTPWLWNLCHASLFSGIEVIALDKKAKSFHWNDPLTWEDAICAITRLYDSTDRVPLTIGDANGDDIVNAADIVEVVNYIMGNPSEKFNRATADVNGDGVVNAADIVLIVNIIMAK